MWGLRRTIKSCTYQNVKRFRSFDKVIGRRHYFRNKEEDLFKEGTDIEGFVVTQVSKIPEFFLTGVQLKHVDTGAQYLHLARNDPNNAFSVGFRTTPFDSTGIPHILEHLCTCGSEKYPCRDPYFKMLCRSMATFMNAMTGPDYTIYPFSTQNHRDYMNLMSVYMDAVFRPMLREMDFLQEGWRLEHQDVCNPKTPIIFKGVVLNEMKGVFSDNQNIFYNGILNTLLPSHTYGVVSGGNPLHIPSLTYENLVQFHKDHYHPSNAKFYSYGNFPLVESLKFINDEYLTSYGKVDKLYSDGTSVPLEPKWLSPKRNHIDCRTDKMVQPDKQSWIAISQLCCDICDVHKTFLMSVLSDLLVSGPNSSFYRSLVEPNIGSGFSTMTGYFNHTRSTFFSVSLQGLNSKDFDWFIDTYNKTVDNVIDKGFDEKNIEGVLHNIELSMKHQAADFGLGMLFSIVSPWVHDGDIFEFMKTDRNMKMFRKTIADNPRFLQECVKEYLKDNTHRLTVSMSPSDSYDQEIKKLEENLLHGKLSSMPEDQIKEVYDQGLFLKKNQEKVEDISFLPTLKISDLNKDIEKIELDNTNISGIPVQICIQPTNGIMYFYGVLNTADIPEECKNILPIFCYVADKMGTPNIDYRTLDQEILTATRGLSFGYFNSESLNELNNFEEGVTISSHCLTRNAEKMFGLWSEVFGIGDGSVFEDVERFETLVSLLSTNYSSSVIHNGHRYAMLSSSSLVSDSARRKELCGGLSMMKTLQDIVSQRSEVEKAMGTVKKTAALVLDRCRLRTAVNVGPDDRDKMLQHLNSFFGVTEEAPKYVRSSQSKNSFDDLNRGIHFVMPGQVNFTAKSILTVPYTHEDFAVLRVLCRLITMKYCIPIIREKGGAYGAGANLSTGGVLSFYSYRDPNSVETFNAFDDAYNWILKKQFTKQDVEEAILGTFQAVDAPIPPCEKGTNTFFYGLSNEILRQHRLALMAVTEEKLLNVATKYLVPNESSLQGRSLIGPINNKVTSRSGESWTVIE